VRLAIYVSKDKVEERKARTCNPDPINIIWDHTFPFHDIIELGTPAVEDDGIQANTVKETETQSKLIELREDAATDLDDGKFGRLRRV
jgi:hypothetical protein